jgi:hypothetical protein
MPANEISPIRLPDDHSVKGASAKTEVVAGVGGQGSPPDGRKYVEGAKHGTESAYRWDGCRCQVCVDARTLSAKKARVAKARGKGGLVDKRPVFMVLGYAIAVGFKLDDIGRQAGRGVDYCDRIRASRFSRMRAPMRDSILTAVRVMVNEQRERLDDLEAAIDYAQGRTSEALFEPEPLKAALHGRMKGLLSEADRRQLHRHSPLPATRVTRICAAAGLDPESVYGDAWWGLEEAG